METETRTCKTCKEAKPLDAFYVKKASTTKTGFQRAWSCKACQSALARQWSKDNPERAARNRWLHDLRTKYGMTEQEWNTLLAAQGGGCAICGEQERNTHPSGTVWRLAVDHCHNTNRVRGILCNTCNRAIGFLKDDPRLLRKAADYLEE